MVARRIDPQRVREIPRPHPNPLVEWHLQMFDHADFMAVNIHSFQIHFEAMADDELKSRSITVGPRLDVDDEAVMEPRFFSPSPKDDIERIIQRASKTEVDIWPRMGCFVECPMDGFKRHRFPENEQWLHAYHDLSYACEVSDVFDALIGEMRKQTWERSRFVIVAVR